MQFRVLSFLALLAVLVAASPVPQPQIEERAAVSDTAPPHHGIKHMGKAKAQMAKAQAAAAGGTSQLAAAAAAGPAAAAAGLTAH